MENGFCLILKAFFLGYFYNLDPDHGPRSRTVDPGPWTLCPDPKNLDPGPEP